MDGRRGTFQIVHYLVPGTWELEELLPDGDVRLAESDVGSWREFSEILSGYGLRLGGEKTPYNSKMELFEAVRA